MKPHIARYKGYWGVWFSRGRYKDGYIPAVVQSTLTLAIKEYFDYRNLYLDS
jgi:hypothetical protein